MHKKGSLGLQNEEKTERLCVKKRQKNFDFLKFALVFETRLNQVLEKKLFCKVLTKLVVGAYYMHPRMNVPYFYITIY